MRQNTTEGAVARPADAPSISLGDEVYRQLLTCMDEGEWTPGERLPSESDLSERFSVSRPVLRQALGRLRAESRIFSRKGSGHYVREVGAEITYSFGTLHNVPDVRAFLEFRCFMESEIAAQAAARRDPESIDRIQECNQALKAAILAGKPAIDEDIGFHMAIALASGNRFFISTLAALGSQTQCSIRLIRELADRPLAERFADINQEHQRILDCITAGDPDGARAAMADHLQGGIRRLFGH